MFCVRRRALSRLQRGGRGDLPPATVSIGTLLEKLKTPLRHAHGSSLGMIVGGGGSRRFEVHLYASGPLVSGCKRIRNWDQTPQNSPQSQKHSFSNDLEVIEKNGAPDVIRTRDPLLRRGTTRYKPNNSSRQGPMKSANRPRRYRLFRLVYYVVRGHLHGHFRLAWQWGGLPWALSTDPPRGTKGNGGFQHLARPR